MKYLLMLVVLIVVIGFSQSGCRYDKDLLNARCDTTATATYSGWVKPILTANCIKCHVGPNAPYGNGILLDDYVYVIKQVANGQLMLAITHTGGVTPMPKDANMLDACSIAKIKKWIAEGAKPN